MALLQSEGFDYLGASYLPKKWTDVSYVQLKNTSPRRPGTTYMTSTPGYACYIRKNVSPNSNTVFAGCAIHANNKTFSLDLIDDVGDIFLKLSSRYNSITTNQELFLDIIGLTSVPILLINSSFDTDTWVYVELKCKMAGDNTGEVEVHLNENPVYINNAIQTLIGGTRNLEKVSYGGYGTSIDDIYICDSSESNCNNFLGDVVIKTIRPMAAGANTDFTPNGAVDNYDCVDDVVTDENTYVSSSNIDDKDTYVYSDVDTTDEIVAVVSNIIGKKDGPGVRLIKPCSIINSTEVLGNEFSLFDSVSHISTTMPVNPITGLKWTADEVNAAEFGVIISG